jgi:spore maturation protein CgeB
MTNTIGPCKGIKIDSAESGARLFSPPEGRLKRVLIVYFSRPPIIDYLKRAFSACGVDARGFFSDGNNWFDRYVIRPINKTAHNFRIIPKNRFLFEDHPLCQLRYRNRRLLEEVNSFRPELVFIIRGYRYLPETLAEVRRKCLVFGWWIEREEGSEEAIREAPLFDYYFFLHSAVVEEAQKKGLPNIGHMRHCVDTSVFRVLDIGKKYDWCFVGGWSEKRQRFLEKAAEVSANGALYGPRWKKRLGAGSPLRPVLKGESVWGEDLVRLYNESRVVINHTNWGPREGRSGTTMRVLEGAACGSCVLTDGSRDLASLVTPGKDVVLYEDAEDLGVKLGELLGDEKRLEEIAASGLGHVQKKFSYEGMANKIIETYDTLRARGKATKERGAARRSKKA